MVKNFPSILESETFRTMDFLCMLFYILFFWEVIVAWDTSDSGKLGMIFTFC